MKTLSLLAALLLLSPPARADDVYPSQTVRIVVPSSPGGPIDAVARILAEGLRTVWPVSVVIENKPGAGTSTGAAFVAAAAPDGYTLLVNPDSIAVNPSLYPNVGYDPLKSFAPISMLVTATQVLVVRPDLGVSDINGFLAMAKAKPAGLNMASAGTGTISHLTEVLLEQRMNYTTSHIPFRGAAPALTAMLGRHVDGMWVMLAPAVAYLKSGQLKALAVTSRARDPNLPDVLTAEEQGVPDFEVTNWQGLFAPAGTPASLVEKIRNTVAEVLQIPEVRARMRILGFEPRGDGPAVVAEQIRLGVPKWAAVVKRAGIQLSQ